MLKGKIAIVTGASRGIGEAIALKLAELGANIVLNYRRDDARVKALIQKIEGYGVKAKAVQGDVSQFEDAKKIMTETIETFGRIDILVNNAGITKDTLLVRMKEEDFSSVIDVNLKGAFNCTKHASKIMMKQRDGNIVNMASVIGLIGNVGQANYAASKAGLIGLTKSVAKEMAPRGVRVNAIAPGFIETSMTDKLSEDVKKNMLKNIPLNRLGQTEDVANLVAFLVSDQSNYITGQVINVDGGMVM